MKEKIENRRCKPMGKGYTTCRNPNATKGQEKQWNRMVKDLERRDRNAAGGTNA